MKPEHWIQRWQDHQIGFHQDQINPWLIEYWPQTGVAAGAQVFVPLSGKSLDMWWLSKQGHPVLGVELSPIAVADFFAAADVEPQHERDSRFERSSGEGVALWCGDFFALTAADLSQVAAVYDRAALIAMPPAMRPDYAAQLLNIVPAGAPILLVTMEYPAQQMHGPPFPVDEPEVHALFGNACRIERLAVADILDQEPRFRARGLSALVEKAYLLRRD